MPIINLKKCTDAQRDAVDRRSMEYFYSGDIEALYRAYHRIPLIVRMAEEFRDYMGLPGLVIGGWNLSDVYEKYGEKWFIEKGVNWLEVEKGDEVLKKYKHKHYEKYLNHVP